MTGSSAVFSDLERARSLRVWAYADRCACSDAVPTVMERAYAREGAVL